MMVEASENTPSQATIQANAAEEEATTEMAEVAAAEEAAAAEARHWDFFTDLTHKREIYAVNIFYKLQEVWTSVDNCLNSGLLWVGLEIVDNSGRLGTFGDNSGRLGTFGDICRHFGTRQMSKYQKFN